MPSRTLYCLPLSPGKEGGGVSLENPRELRESQIGLPPISGSCLFS